MLKKVLKTGALVLAASVLVLVLIPQVDFADAELNSQKGFGNLMFLFGKPDDGAKRPPRGQMGRPPIGEFGQEQGSSVPNRPPGDMQQGEMGMPQIGEGMNGSFGPMIKITEDDQSTSSVSITVNDSGNLTYPIVDTNQKVAFDEMGVPIDPGVGDALYGQDANYDGYQPNYKDNGDGTVSDLVTGLMWTQDPGKKMGLTEALDGAEGLEVGGYDDWRLPTIKELYSLIQFSGTDPAVNSTVENGLIPFIDTDYFDFEYGDTDGGERIIDSQFASSTIYESTTMFESETVFGVNFADGRIKGYPIYNHREGSEKQFYVLYVRGNSKYGENDFVDNGDGTITDLATGLMWLQDDNGEAISWSEALVFAEDTSFAGYDDWRLPNAKELQSIVDYSRSPDTTESAAIDPLFNVTEILDEGGSANYPFYWTGTTHISHNRGGKSAVYVAFGEALGFMTDQRTGETSLVDVHGAGAQRSDMKTGDAEDYPMGNGPQGDVIRIDHFVRLVRSVQIEE